MNNNNNLSDQDDEMTTLPANITAHENLGSNEEVGMTYSSSTANSTLDGSSNGRKTLPLFMGQKERRKSSITSKNYQLGNISLNPDLPPPGDYLSLSTQPAVQKLMSKNQESTVVFSDIVIKINKRNKMQERVLLITDKNIYNLSPQSYRPKRIIELKSLSAISLSRLPDNFFCLHVDQEYDYLLVSSRKSEIVERVREIWSKEVSRKGSANSVSTSSTGSGDQLPINFANQFHYKIDIKPHGPPNSSDPLSHGTWREIIFTHVDGGISTQIFSAKRHK